MALRPISFTPDPEIDQYEHPGTGEFVLEDGSKWYLKDPDMAAEAQRIQAERDEGMLANLDGAFGKPKDPDELRAWLSETQSQAAPARGVHPAPVPAVPSGPGGIDQYAGVGETDALPPLPGVNGVPEASAPQQPQQPSALDVVGVTPEDVRAAMNARVAVPGVDPMKMRAEGVPVPQTTTTEGGIPMEVYQTQARARQRAANEAVDARRSAAMLKASRMQHEAAQLQAELPDMQRAAAAQQSEFIAEQNRIKRERDQLYDEINNFDPKIDSRRIFKNKGTFAEILAVIGQALGAYSATVTGGQNWAQKYVNDAIDRDIAEQEHEIRQGRISQNNKLAQLSAKYEDLNQAKAALKMQMQGIADKERNAYALETGAEDVIAANQAWEAEQRQARVQQESEFFNAALGKRTTSEKFVQPRAGGSRAKTLDEKLDTAEKYLKFQKGEQDLAKGERELSGENVDRKELREFGKKKEEIASAKKALLNYAEAMGVKFDPVTGKITNREEVLKKGIPGAGATGTGMMEEWLGFMPGYGGTGENDAEQKQIDAEKQRTQELLLSEEGRTVRRTARRAVQGVVKAISGATATDQERAEIRGGMGVDAVKDEDVLNGLEEAWRVTNEKDREIENTHGGAYVRQRQRQTREVGRIRGEDDEEAY